MKVRKRAQIAKTIKRLLAGVRTDKLVRRPAARSPRTGGPVRRGQATSGGAINWNRNQPVVNALRKHLPKYFPQIKKAGGYVARKTETGKFSAHSEGRAVDIYLNANHPGDRALGDALAHGFRTWSKQLGVDHVIWNRQIWSRKKGGFRAWDPSRNPHTNHVHVAFTRSGSQSSEQQVLKMLNSIAGTRVEHE